MRNHILNPYIFVIESHFMLCGVGVSNLKSIFDARMRILHILFPKKDSMCE